MALITFFFASDKENHARQWAKSNFSGLENSPVGAALFSSLVEPLRGTPGRLAYDLHPDNERLGSSRIFEVVPHLTGKPITEGGIVNSAIGSLSAYILQGELSEMSAGAPPRVKLQNFNIDAAVTHMDFMRVKHLIVRSPHTRRAMLEQPNWHEKAREQEWSLFENEVDNGQLVRMAVKDPLFVITDNWKDDALEWLYLPSAAERAVILSDAEEELPSELINRKSLSRGQYKDYLNTIKDAPAPEMSSCYTTSPVTNESFDGKRLTFSTTAIGKPHVIAISWFPNWHVDGADRVFRIAPGMMLVFPDRRDVCLYYAKLPSDIAGAGISIAGILILIMLHIQIRRNRRPASEPRIIS